MPGTGEDPRISLHMNLREIMDVIESLPEGHPLIPMLNQKRETLFAIYKLKFRKNKMKRHETWCPMFKLYSLAFMDPDNEWCKCRAERIAA